MLTPSAASPDREALAGLVERVMFHNPEGSFCVLRVKVCVQRELVTVIGTTAAISVGELVQTAGGWVNDRANGLQFKASFLEAAPPAMLEGIKRRVGSGMIEGTVRSVVGSWRRPLARRR